MAIDGVRAIGDDQKWKEKVEDRLQKQDEELRFILAQLEAIRRGN